MTGAAFFLYCLGLAVSPAYLGYTLQPAGSVRSIIKILPLSFLTLASFLADAPPFLTLALFFSALGDLALSRNGRAAFIYGLSAFALAHILLILLFQLVSHAQPWEAFISAPFLAVPLLILALSTEIWLSPFTGSLRWPVRIYVGLITMMGLSALTLPAGFELVVIGAFSFAASDSLLAILLFREPANKRLRNLLAWALWVLYIAAAALILWGALAG